MYAFILLIFAAIFSVIVIHRNKLANFIYDPFLHVLLLSLFSTFFVVPYLMLNDASRYEVEFYSGESQTKYFFYTATFNALLTLIAFIAAKNNLLVGKKDVAKIVENLRLAKPQRHWIIICMISPVIAYPIYAIGRDVLSMGFGAYLANRIVVASGLGYLFAFLTYPLFVALILCTNLALRKPTSTLMLARSFAKITIVSTPLILSGSRSSLAIGILIFLFILLILSSPRSLTFIKQKAIRISIFVIALLIGLTILGAIRQQIMGSGDLEVTSIETEHRSSSTLEVFGTNENLLWMFDNSQYVDFLYGKTFAAVLLGPFPRSLWPGKPTGGGPVMKNWIAPGSYDLSTGENISSYTTGFMSETYMNFGWAGVIVGPIMLSVLCIIFSSLIKKVSTEVGLVCWAVLAMRFLGFVNSEFYGVCIHIFIALLFFLAYKFLYRILSKRNFS